MYFGKEICFILICDSTSLHINSLSPQDHCLWEIYRYQYPRNIYSTFTTNFQKYSLHKVSGVFTCILLQVLNINYTMLCYPYTECNLNLQKLRIFWHRTTKAKLLFANACVQDFFANIQAFSWILPVHILDVFPEKLLMLTTYHIFTRKHSASPSASHIQFIVYTLWCQYQVQIHYSSVGTGLMFSNITYDEALYKYIWLYMTSTRWLVSQGKRHVYHIGGNKTIILGSSYLFQYLLSVERFTTNKDMAKDRGKLGDLI